MPLENEEVIQDDQPVAEPSLRDVLTASADAVETSTADESQHAADDAARARDEQGRFKAKQETQEVKTEQVAQPTEAPTAAPVQEPATLTTWRKEYLPIQQKLAAGQSLSAEEAKKLADYNVQREREYSTGIATYKAEAQATKVIADVMQEFMPALQQVNMKPEQWIQNMGRTHAALVYGTPEQKLGIFAQLMQNYNIPAEALFGALQGQPNPEAMQSMHAHHQQMSAQQQQQRIQYLEQQLQQQQDQEVMKQLEKFRDTTQFPHFSRVQGKMAQLLEAGLAQDPDSAYSQAILLDPEIREAEQQRQAADLAAQEAAKRQAAVNKARQAGGSLRSGSSAVSAPSAPTDIRQSLEAAFEQHAGGGRV